MGRIFAAEQQKSSITHLLQCTLLGLYIQRHGFCAITELVLSKAKKHNRVAGVELVAAYVEGEINA